MSRDPSSLLIIPVIYSFPRSISFLGVRTGPRGLKGSSFRHMSTVGWYTQRFRVAGPSFFKNRPVHMSAQET